MKSFGLIIDEQGIPGLHVSVEAAKEALQQEIVALWKDLYPDAPTWRVDWGFGVDADFERVTIYDMNDEVSFMSDSYLDFQVWDVTLNV
jgi:hypothetical protein